ncbi:MAG: hypothetical protein QOF36_2568 [Microbacteriaceae bacterium]|nr:hypothetical protein [Microbacteriaceae bacterium]
MADPLVRRAKKWTYLTWCDLRNHPLMLVGALIGAIAFAVYFVQQSDTNKRIGTVETVIKVPRRCQALKYPDAPHTIILICNPATKREIATAKRHARQGAREAAGNVRARARRKAARTRGQNGGPLPGGRSGSRNGSQGVAPSPSHQPQPPSRPPSGGGSSSPPSSPPARAAPSPGLTTPPLGPIPSLTVPLPSPSLPPLPRAGQLTG